MSKRLPKPKKAGAAMTTSVRVHPATIRGEVRYVSIPGSGPKERGPQTELQCRTFLVDSIEACAKVESIERPSFQMVPSDGAIARDAGLTDDEIGFVVGFGETKYVVRVSKLAAEAECEAPCEGAGMKLEIATCKSERDYACIAISVRMPPGTRFPEMQSTFYAIDACISEDGDDDDHWDIDFDFIEENYGMVLVELVGVCKGDVDDPGMERAVKVACRAVEGFAKQRGSH